MTEKEGWAFKAWCAENRISQVDAFRQAFILLRGSRAIFGALTAEVVDEALWSVTSFMIDKGMNLRVERRAEDQWAVCENSDVINQDGKPEHEPLPSARDDAFIARRRLINGRCLREHRLR